MSTDTDGWPPLAMVFVIDAEMKDQAALDAARNHIGEAARALGKIDGVRLTDMGVGLAINETRNQVLELFGKPPVETTIEQRAARPAPYYQ